MQFHCFVRLKPHVVSLISNRNHSQYWRSKKEIHTIREDRTRVRPTILHNILLFHSRKINNCVFFHRASGTVFTAIDIATGQEVMQESKMDLLLLVFHGFIISICFSSGGYQTDQPAEAAQERADHQRNSCHEGTEESKHCQLLRQVNVLQETTSLVNFVNVAFSSRSKSSKLTIIIEH